VDESLALEADMAIKGCGYVAGFESMAVYGGSVGVELIED
jgi:hypothetical protein